VVERLIISMSLILKVDQNSSRRDEIISQAAQIILRGGLLAFPTETFYGLAALASDREAVEQIYAIKRRPRDKSLSILIADVVELENWVENIPAAAQHLIARFWPGPLTIVFPVAEHLPTNLTATTGKVGVRISSHPIAQALVHAVGAPITATSANRSGAQSCRSSNEVLAQMGADLKVVLDAGLTPGGKVSTIVDVTIRPPKILRAGAIASQEVVSCWE
jgi:L-threonylcarbamoyladenylate synthase